MMSGGFSVNNLKVLKFWLNYIFGSFFRFKMSN